MSYSEFTLEKVAIELGVTTQQASLFPNLTALEVPAWLSALLSKQPRLAAISEKARSEFIVVPILLACRDLSQNQLAIFSGQRFDVDPERGLIGECDFILAMAPPVPPLRAPILTIVEAKKNDVESGLGQCIAEMVAAEIFNRASAQDHQSIYGCVTTGEVWQFLRLSNSTALIDEQRYYLDNVGKILSAIQAIVSRQRAEGRGRGKAAGRGQGAEVGQGSGGSGKSGG